MSSEENSIERNVKLIAIFGMLIFATLIGAMFIVQQILGASQTKLAETVVPLQQQIDRITGAEGAMFRRQGEIVAANDLSLQAIGNRAHHEDGIRSGAVELRNLVVSTGVIDDPGFPVNAADSLEEEIEIFLNADDELYDAACSYQNLKVEFASSVERIDRDMRQVIEASNGLAGVLRLEYISQLRRLSDSLGEEGMQSELLQQLISGDSRLQLDAISQLDAAVLQLGVLAGRVGLATSDDSLNSLAANELVQNRERIMQALDQLDKLITDDELKLRLRLLKELTIDLSRLVGEDSLPNSLSALHRQKLREEHHVHLSQLSMASVSERLEDSTEKLRNYLRNVADRAKDSSELTILRSQQLMLSISFTTLFFGIIGAFRIRTSILALRLQNERLRNMSNTLTQTNLGLEQAVASRTASLQLVLDSTGDGLLAIDLKGVLLPERSKTVTLWFGPSKPNETIWEYLKCDESTKETLKLAIEQIADDVLPFSVSADQAPKLFARNERTYTLEYRAIYESDRLARILVAIRDISAVLVAEKAELEMRELHTLVGNILKDRNGFEQTLQECETLLSEISSVDDQSVVNRNLHTLKGSWATIGFHHASNLVHELESKLAAEVRVLTEQEFIDLNRHWKDSLSKIRNYICIKQETHLEIASWEFAELKGLIEQHASYEKLSQLVDNWRNEPTSIPLSRLADQAKQVAAKLGKEVDVSIHCNHLRMPSERFQRFWSAMMHAIRNSIDHGVESPEERRGCGKSPTARLEIFTEQIDQNYEVSLSDDGRGIDWNRVRQIAEQRGMPNKTEDDLLAVLFSEGVSTRNVVTNVSGRGVGLSVVRSECEKAGGAFRVLSSSGKGTRFIFSFSKACNSYPVTNAVNLLETYKSGSSLAGSTTYPVTYS